MKPKIKREKRIRRHRKVRAKIKGTTQVPRLCVFRSRKHIYAQLIDDEKGKMMVVVNDFEIKKPKVSSSGPNQETKIKRTRKTAIAYNVGKLIAEKAIKRKIKKVVFDRGSSTYHGRVRALAEGAREGGLIF